MDRIDGVMLLVAVAGVALLLLVPSGPSYEVGSQTAPEISPDEVTPFPELDTEAQREFLENLNTTTRPYEEPALAEYTRYVRYEGRLYEIILGVRPSTFRSVFVPMAGRGLVGIGVLCLAGRLLWVGFS